MEITLRSLGLRRAAMAFEVAAFLGLTVWISKAYLAEHVARKPTVRNLQFALKLDPANADYHLRLGRLFEYSLTDVDPNRAAEHLQRAAELNPHDARAWVEWAAAFEFQGRVGEAEACLRRAGYLAPRIPSIQWVLGNFFLLHGNIDEAFQAFKVVLAGSSQYDRILFDTAWKASGDGQRILDQLIPDNPATEFSYLSYLASRQRFAETATVWKRMVNSPQEFRAAQAAGFLENLIQAGRPAEAHQVWKDLIARGLIKRTYEVRNENLIVNGDFEDDLLGLGFDWRIYPREGVYVGLDGTSFHSPSHSLLVQFSGKENIDYRQILQYVPVSPGRSYHLRAFLRTQGITSESGPRVEVRDVYNPAALNKFSNDLVGDTTGWTLVSLDFTTGPKTALIAVGLSRLPSQKLDNLIAGEVWMDDLILTAMPGASSEGRSPE